jgi:hypothetical protein
MTKRFPNNFNLPDDQYRLEQALELSLSLCLCVSVVGIGFVES